MLSLTSYRFCSIEIDKGKKSGEKGQGFWNSKSKYMMRYCIFHKLVFISKEVYFSFGVTKYTYKILALC